MIVIVTPNRDKKFKAKVRSLYGNSIIFAHNDEDVYKLHGTSDRNNKVYHFGRVNLSPAAYFQLVYFKGFC